MGGVRYTYQWIYIECIEFEMSVGHPSEDDEQRSGQIDWEPRLRCSTK